MNMADLKGFSEGKHEFRPAPFWSWNDKLDAEELLSQMKKMQKAGYGGFFMHSRVGLITPYLSDEWMDCIRLCAKKSGEYGLDAYLYDEDMWPSGYASGIVPAMSDDFKEKALVLAKEGELLPSDEPFKTVESGGEKYTIARRTCAAGMVRFNGQCYIDTLNPRAVRAFLESTHEKYKACVGEMFGTRIRGIFTDEPCYGIHWFYTLPHVTYSEYLRERILREKGYDVKERCEELFFDVGNYKKTRSDYYNCAGKQFEESFTKQYADWCERNNLCFTGHLMAEETMAEQAQWTGGVMRHYADMQQPGVDKLMRRNSQLVTLKQLTSVTEQLGKERALSECFAGLGHESGYVNRKKIMDWQAVNGIDFVNMHLSHYSLRGERKRDYPPDIFYQQPYFCEEKLFSDYAARLCQIAAYGKRAVRLLIIQPLSCVFAHYNPADAQNPEKLRAYDELFAGLSEALQAAGVDFHYGDESLLEKYASADKSTLRVGAYSYDTVVLCNAESLSESTLRLLDRFGGRILCLGQRPEWCDFQKRESVRVDERFDEIAPLVELVSDCRAAIYAGENIICCRRTAERGDILLFANTGDEKQVLRAELLDGAFALDLTHGKAYPLRQNQVTLLAEGSLAVFTGAIEVLKEWGVPVCPPPAIGCDGVEFSDFEAREIPVHAARVCDENALVLDRADFECEGVRLENSPLEAIWHYHFYKLPEGAPYTMRYRFYVRDVPERAQLVVENAENAQYIAVNQRPVKPLRARGEAQRCDEKAYKDLSFTRCEGVVLKKGWNEVELRARKINNITDVCCHRPVHEKNYAPTEAEAAYIIGDFSVLSGEHGYEIAAPESPLRDAAAEGYPFYSGALEYEAECDLNGRETLLLEGDCAYASVEANGRKLTAGGTLAFDTRGISGRVRLKIKLYNTLFALLGPHHIRDYDDLSWVDAGVFNDLDRYEKRYLTKPFGLRKIKIIQGVDNNEK